MMAFECLERDREREREKGKIIILSKCSVDLSN